MKLYFIYAERDKLTKEIYHSISPSYDVSFHDKEYILYAFTNNKSYLNRFLKERMDIFKVVKKEISEEEYTHKISLNDKRLQLKECTYDNGRGCQVEILGPLFEYEKCHCYWFEDILLEENFKYINCNVTDIFKDKYIEAFSFIGLNSMVYICDTNLDESIDYIFNEFCFNDDASKVYISPLAPFQKNPHTEISFQLGGREVNLFIHYYKSILRLK
jgi:hypothetical protein